MRRIATLLLLGTAVGGTAAWWLQRQTAAALRSEIAVAKEQIDALARLRNENARLAESLPSPDELERLRSDRAALSRLRGEVDAMRDEIERRARAQAATGTPAPRKPLPGTESSTTAAQMVHRAITGGDTDTLERIIQLAPDAGGIAQQALARIPLLKRSPYPSVERLVAELMCATIPGGGEVVLATSDLQGVQGVQLEISNYWRAKARTVVTDIQAADGHVREDRQVYVEMPDGWRWVVSRELLMKRLVETGLVPPSPNHP